jgi:periplasmic divalent cation tolerance protein
LNISERTPVTTPTPDIVIVLTTLDAGADAQAFARTLVEERLAACVSILPEMTSVYRWRGDIAHGAERQLLIKTSPDRLPALQSRLQALHPYELPELIGLSAEASPAYLAWVRESVA